ncbi:MAG: WYL domain-containing protein [Oscillospiraceae bacterium]|nr:WYL domain-containing protein [Oscillospiraceae bacterium]
MAGKLNSKLKLLYIRDIFLKYSDEQHIINAQEIVEKLHNLYGLDCERKSIYNDIDVLTDYGMDIVHTRTPKHGYFLASGDFQIPEIRLLSDAVQSAKFITRSKTKELIGKIEAQTSIYQAAVLKKQVYIENRNKSKNESVYYVIDALDNAIKTNKKVCVEYSKRRIDDKYAAVKETRSHVLSPYSLIWADDHYYLVANNEKYDNLMHLRIDRIQKVEVLEDAARRMSEVSPYKTYFDAADYASKHFNMFSGKLESVELKCENAILEQMLDRFGDNVNTRAYDETHFLLRTEVAINKGVATWIMQFGNQISVMFPTELRDMVKTLAEDIVRMYDEEAAAAPRED